MKTLDELYFELREHPDCIRLQILDRGQVVYDVRDAIEYLQDGMHDEDQLDRLAEQWYEEHKQILKSRLSNFYEEEDGIWTLDYSKIEEWLKTL